MNLKTLDDFLVSFSVPPFYEKAYHRLFYRNTCIKAENYIVHMYYTLLVLMVRSPSYVALYDLEDYLHILIMLFIFSNKNIY